MKKHLLLSLVLMLGFCTQLWAQDRVVSGKVTSSEDGAALPGVGGAVKGTPRGVQTDANGIYNVSVPHNAPLTF